MKKKIKLDIVLPVISVSWCRKACIGGVNPFAVSFDSDEAMLWQNVPLVHVSTQQYDVIGKTLDDIDEAILSQVDYKTVFVITDGARYLAVDTQGFKYPRYKSAVYMSGRVLPF